MSSPPDSTVNPTALFRAVYSGPGVPPTSPYPDDAHAKAEQVDITFSHPLKRPFPTPNAPGPAPLSASDPTSAKKAYIEELRGLVPAMQEDINQFLTKRMEQDRISLDPRRAAADEKKAEYEERNYGEEVADDQM